jgi:2,4-diacetylphloroglucinol hydrolase
MSFTPVTYYPPVMQEQFRAAEKAVAGSPYERHLAKDLTVPLEVALGIQSGPLDASETMAPSVEALNAMLADTKRRDWGWAVLEGPTLYVQSRVDFPGSTPEMFEWWFWWHTLDPRRYMLWFPWSHVSATPEDPERMADDSLSFAERFYGNRHHVKEWMGPEFLDSIINFTDPAVLGFDPASMKAAGFAASASGLLEMPGLPDVTVGMMVHIVRPVPGGMELVSRYWLGSHPELRRFPGAEKAADLFASVGMNAEKLGNTAYELSVHDMTEWNNLARILPGLYREFGPQPG